MKEERKEILEKAISKVATKGIKEIEKIQGGLEINKSELVRDLAVSLIAKIQSLYKAGDKEELKDYDKYVAGPITSIIDVARKTNRDIFEMKYGKKIVTEKRGEFEDMLDKAIDVTLEVGNGDKKLD